jgi:hypothetical protein
MYKIELVSFDTQTKAGSPHSYYVGRVLFKSGRGYTILESKSYNKNLFSHKRAMLEFMDWTERRGYLNEDLTTESKNSQTLESIAEHQPI